MIAFLLYILKSAFCLLLFYACYKALCSNDTFFRINRRILLGGTVVCMMIPFVHIEVKQTRVQQPIIMLEQMLDTDMSVEENLNFISEEPREEFVAAATASEIKALSLSQIFCILYFSGTLICLIITAVSYFKMWRLICGGRQEKRECYVLVVVNENVMPFSWWKYAVFSEVDYQCDNRDILQHELSHIRNRHSIDLIFTRLLLVVQWFNPAMWLLERELKDVHEFEADQSVLNTGINAIKYQLLIVKKAVGSSSYAFANGLNHSKIKKRITMMLKEKSSGWNRLKPLLLIPASLLAIYVFAHPTKSRQSGTLLDKDTKVLQDISFQRVDASYLEDNAIKVKHSVFVNYRGAILFDGKECTLDVFSDIYEKTLSKDDSNTQFFINFQYDISVNKDTLFQIEKILKTAENNNSNTKVLLVDIKNYSSKVKFAAPCNKGKISSPFGNRNGKFHNGIDIVHKKRTLVYAAADGIVSDCGNDEIIGNFIDIVHADGYVTSYQHLDELLVEKDAKVKAKQQIGTVGNSGRSTGAHLHFGLKKNNEWIDPTIIVQNN